MPQRPFHWKVLLNLCEEHDLPLLLFQFIAFSQKIVGFILIGYGASLNLSCVRAVMGISQ